MCENWMTHETRHSFELCRCCNTKIQSHQHHTARAALLAFRSAWTTEFSFLLSLPPSRLISHSWSRTRESAVCWRPLKTPQTLFASQYDVIQIEKCPEVYRGVFAFRTNFHLPFQLLLYTRSICWQKSVTGLRLSTMCSSVSYELISVLYRFVAYFEHISWNSSCLSVFCIPFLGPSRFFWNLDFQRI